MQDSRFLEALENMVAKPEQIIFTNEEAANKLGVNKRTLQNWRDDGILGYRKVRGTIFYSLADILSMLDNHYHPPASKNY